MSTTGTGETVGLAEWIIDDACLVYFNFLLQIVVPSLPSKALKRQLPFRNDDGIYEEGFIEERRAGLESFVNK